MLTLQRASAGSGKTYALARSFIRFLISIRTDERPLRRDPVNPEIPIPPTRRLRTEAELHDSLSHILAITFTNKATAEMKLRIVAALANMAADDANEKTDYLKDFAQEFNTSMKRVSQTARQALFILLNDYSNFKVSTIDSFFQTVLRTFAFEAHLNDTYGLEIDTDFLNLATIESLFEAIDSLTPLSPANPTNSGTANTPNNGTPNNANSGTANPSEIKSSDPSNPADIRFWFEILMKKEKKGWNPFLRNSGNGVYQRINIALQRLEKEEFKEIRDALDNYFSQHNFRATYITLSKHFAEKEKKIMESLTALALPLLRKVEEAAVNADLFYSKSVAFLRKLAKGEMASIPMTKGELTPLVKASKKKKDPYAEERDAFQTEYAILLDQLIPVQEELKEIGLWKLYDDLLPYLGIILCARHYQKDILDENNSVMLAETNSILSKLIGELDTPFLYERLGARLNHLLIDEFQDTSRLQWHNLRPLVSESLSKGCESLLIGDAKQSIYRFRNADPSIITSLVGDQFKGSILPKGEKVEDNTNWRSDQRIVQFNNFLFHQLAARLGKETEQLYSNVVQHPVSSVPRGFVSVRCVEKEATDTEDEEGMPLPTDYPSWFSELGPMIEEMIARGYRQRDIAILAKGRQELQEAFAAITDFNTLNRNKEGFVPIELISDDSLKLGNSPAVLTVINCLRNLASGTIVKRRSGEESLKRGTADWHEIRTELIFFINNHQDLTPEQQIEQFFANDESRDKLAGLVAGMEATTLPALVETLAKHFLDKEVRRREAPFLATLQDAVLSYCSTYAADIASFLKWWDLKGSALSIPPAEDANAVSLLTIHKSKGLEFGCVILPKFSPGLLPKSSKKSFLEWSWVEPRLEIPSRAKLPPFLPVELKFSQNRTAPLYGTPHEHLLDELAQAVAVETLNLAYVAFTRAVNELYVFMPQKKHKTKAAEDSEDGAKKSGNERYLSTVIADILRKDADSESAEGTEDSDSIAISRSGTTYSKDSSAIDSGTDSQANDSGTDSRANDSGVDSETGGNAFSEVFEFGAPLTREEIDEINSKRNRKKEEESAGRKVSRNTDYPINDDISFLKFEEENPLSRAVLLGPEDEHEDDPLEDTDPRSEGNLLHSALQWTALEQDLPKALMSLKIAGYIPASRLADYRKRLGTALASVRKYGWFAPGWTLLQERSIMENGQRTKRPDRVMLSPDRKRAIVVDYKFGANSLKMNADGTPASPRSKHLDQIRGYKEALLRSGICQRVKGYLWYVDFNHVVEVD